MHNKFIELDSMFSRKFLKEGIKPYMRNFTKEWLKAANDDLLTINEIVDNSF